jgi:hypothetical protein
MLWRLWNAAPRRLLLAGICVVALQVGFNVLAVAGQMYPKEFRRKARQVVAERELERYSIIVSVHAPAEVEGDVLMQAPHPFSIRAAQYDGISASNRAMIREEPRHMRLVAHPAP